MPLFTDRYGNSPEDAYWPHDMHLDFGGMAVFAEGVAEALGALLPEDSGPRFPIWSLTTGRRNE